MTLLVESIKNYIEVRDEIWRNLASSALPSVHELGCLATANEALREMLELESGLRTPVLDPLAAKLELARVFVCNTFICRIGLEIRARQRAENPGAHLSGAAAFFLANTGSRRLGVSPAIPQS